MSHQIVNCNHIGIFTDNPYRMIEFYRNNFGFRRVKEEILDRKIVKLIFGLNKKCLLIKLTNNHTVIELFVPINTNLKKKELKYYGYNHIGFAVKNRDRLLRLLKQNKARIIKIRRNGHNVFFTIDPDGNRIEIREDL